MEYELANLSKERLIVMFSNVCYGVIEDIEWRFYDQDHDCPACPYSKDGKCLLTKMNISEMLGCADAQDLMRYHAFG